MLFEFHQIDKNGNKSLQTKLDIDKFVMPPSGVILSLYDVSHLGGGWLVMA